MPADRPRWAHNVSRIAGELGKLALEDEHSDRECAQDRGRAAFDFAEGAESMELVVDIQHGGLWARSLKSAPGPTPGA